MWCGCTCTTAMCSLLTVSRGSHSMPWLVAPVKHCMCKCGHAVLLVKRSEVQPAAARDNVLSVSRHTCILNILDHPPTHPNPLQQPLGHHGMHTDWTECPVTCSVGPLISRSEHYTNRYYTYIQTHSSSSSGFAGGRVEASSAPVYGPRPPITSVHMSTPA